MTREQSRFTFRRRGRSPWWALVVCLLLVAVLSGVRPDLTVDFRRDYVDVATGERGELRDFDVTITSAHLVRQIDVGERAYVSTGTFVVVTGEGSVRRKPTFFKNISLQTSGGDLYDPRPEFSAAQIAIAQPGFTSQGSLAFEVPTGQAAQALLLVDPDLGEFDSYDRAVRVDLGLSAATPVAPGPLVLPPSKVRVTR